MESNNPTNRPENLHSSNSNNARTRRTPAPGSAIAAHILIIQPGEDVVEKVKAFVLNQRNNVVIVSALGSISLAILNITLPAGDSDFTYKGQYEISSLTGEFLSVGNNAGSSSFKGSINVHIKRFDNYILSGRAVKLIALSEVRVFLSIYELVVPRNVVAPLVAEPPIDSSERCNINLTIQPGEDVVEKVKAFVLNQRNNVFIVSALGSVSLAILNRTLPVGDSDFTYKGQYEISSLTGWFLSVGNNAGSSSFRASINVDIKRFDNHILSGGAVKLIALSEVRVVLSIYRFIVPRNVVAPLVAEPPIDSFERCITLTIQPGEDVVEKLKTFVFNQHKSVTIVSANGLVSLAALDNSLMHRGSSFTHQGQYQISLEGKLSPLSSLENNADQNLSSLAGSIKVYLMLSGVYLDSGEPIKLIASSVISVIVSTLGAEQPSDSSGKRVGNILAKQPSYSSGERVDNILNNVVAPLVAEPPIDRSERCITLTIQPGEDVVEKVKTFVLNQRKSFTIVSAHGSVSLAVVANIPLHPELNYTYDQGPYQISLTGKLSPSRNYANQNSSSLTGNIKVYLTLEGMKLVPGKAVKLIASSVISVLVSPLVA